MICFQVAASRKLESLTGTDEAAKSVRHSVRQLTRLVAIQPDLASYGGGQLSQIVVV